MIPVMTMMRATSSKRLMQAGLLGLAWRRSSLRCGVRRARRRRPRQVKDPRVGLKAGLRDAGDAARNMELVASLPKPEGFFDPKIAGRRADPAGAAVRRARLPPRRTRRPHPPAPARRFAPAGGGCDFANSDLAFSEDRLLRRQLQRLQHLRHRGSEAPKLLASVVCPGGQGDVSVYGNLLFMSVEQTRGRLDCGTQGVADAGQRRALPRRPHLRHHRLQQAEAGRGGADLPRLAHAHARHRSEGQGQHLRLRLGHRAACARARSSPAAPGMEPKDDPNTALFSIDVIQVPLAAPQTGEASSTGRASSPIPQTGNDRRPVAGRRSRPGHADDRARPTSATTSPSSRRSASRPAPARATASCSTSRDPVHPMRLDQVSDKNFAYWHSATFNNDGTKVIFTDEWGGGTRPRCRATDLPTWGADAIFDIVDRKLQFARLLQDAGGADRARRTASRTTARSSRCPGRDIMVQALVSGRRLGVRLHRLGAPGRDRVLRSRSDRREEPDHSAATGRPTGTTATSTARRSRAGSTSSG